MWRAASIAAAVLSRIGSRAMVLVKSSLREKMTCFLSCAERAVLERLHIVLASAPQKQTLGNAQSAGQHTGLVLSVSILIVGDDLSELQGPVRGCEYLLHAAIHCLFLVKVVPNCMQHVRPQARISFTSCPGRGLTSMHVFCSRLSAVIPLRSGEARKARR